MQILDKGRLLLLEEGHCLREQALVFSRLRQIENIDTLGASSLSTIVQMVANGMELTLLLEISPGLETKHSNVKMLPFEVSEPRSTVGLTWRASSPRREDFPALDQLIRQAPQMQEL